MRNIKAEIFNVLSKGIIISNKSDKYFELANYLNIDENFEKFDEIVNELGYKLIGENGYFYLTKKSKIENLDVESFLSFYKKTIVAISILKQVYPLITAGDIIKITDFIVEVEKKTNSNIDEKLDFLFGNTDKKTKIEEFFKLLEKNFVIEKIDSTDKNSYEVLNSINYFIKIVESV